MSSRELERVETMGRVASGALKLVHATEMLELSYRQTKRLWRRAAVGVLRSWIKQYGVPRALYTDWKNVYKRKATPAEQLRGQVPLTQFGRMCQKLGIRIIAASTPQAKGRVERIHGVHQDRLIKKLRRQGIASYEAANQYLEEKYLAEHNQRFARTAAEPEDYHRRKPPAWELRQICRLETERAIGNDWVIRHHGRYLQLRPGQRYRGSIKSKALVCEWEDDSMAIYHQGEKMVFAELSEAPLKAIPPRAVIVQVRVRRAAKEDHPWRQSYKGIQPGLAAPMVRLRPYASP
ncbi:MAG TPA: hypothetical protein VNB54_14990 [Alphaproteobacteria bacterium]|nr:hypothetical protein [Alphaproteobacteria bacterium]